MKRSRLSEEQIIGILKEHQGGHGAKELCRQHNISETTFYEWKSKYDGLEVLASGQLNVLEADNAGIGTSTDFPTIDAIAEHFYGSFPDEAFSYSVQPIIGSKAIKGE